MNYYYEAIIEASKYIEDNLTQNIEVKDIVRKIGFSQFHFMRVFKSLSGHTISNYIKRRKITEAAKVLLQSDMRIIDIAILYGYGSQEAFTRAFKEIYNVTPNAYRKSEFAFKNVEQIVLSENLLDLKLSKIAPIMPRIVYKDDFILAGMKYKGKNENFEIPKLWNELYSTVDQISNRKNEELCYGFEGYYEDSQKTGFFEYIAGVEVEKVKGIPKNMVSHEVKRHKYAVFPIAAVIENIPKSIGEIYSVHLPNSGLKAVSNFDFECYDASFEANNQNSTISFYIPVE